MPVSFINSEVSPLNRSKIASEISQDLKASTAAVKPSFKNVPKLNPGVLQQISPTMARYLCIVQQNIPTENHIVQMWLMLIYLIPVIDSTTPKHLQDFLSEMKPHV